VQTFANTTGLVTSRGMSTGWYDIIIGRSSLLCGGLNLFLDLFECHYTQKSGRHSPRHRQNSVTTYDSYKMGP
jgi:hypothetical protein